MLWTPQPCILVPANEEKVITLEFCLHLAGIMKPYDLHSIDTLQNALLQYQ